MDFIRDTRPVDMGWDPKPISRVRHGGNWSGRNRNRWAGTVGALAARPPVDGRARAETGGGGLRRRASSDVAVALNRYAQRLRAGQIRYR